MDRHQGSSGVWPGDERGLEDRSRKPSTPSAFEAINSLGGRLRRRVEPACGSSLCQPSMDDGADHVLSTFRCQASVLVGVHLVLCESLRLAKSAFPVRSEWTTSRKFEASASLLEIGLTRPNGAHGSSSRLGAGIS